MPDKKLAILLIALLFIAAVLSGVLALSCDGDGEEDGVATPTVTPQATATATPQDIEDINLSQQADVQAMLRRTGGEVVPADVLYADLTGDGQEEAVVPISSGGTAGNIAFLVLSYQDSELVSILAKVPESGSMRLSVTEGQLVEMQPVYEEGDEPGFPSRIKSIYYGWDGEELVVEREEETPSPYAPPRQ
jgi:hypothetical protein